MSILMVLCGDGQDTRRLYLGGVHITLNVYE